MKSITFFLTTCFAITATFLIACGGNDKTSSKSESEVKEVAPEVVFENEYAELVKVVLEPGESLASHQGNARVIYSLSDYTIEWEEQGQNEGKKSWQKGDVHFHEAGQHSAKNSGPMTAEWLAFVKKDKELPDCSAYELENDINNVAPDYADLLFENEHFKITEVTLPTGVKITTHAGVNRIIYALTDYQILYGSDKEEQGDQSFKSGDAHWHEACDHEVENTGGSEARFLVVAYKKENE